MLLPSHANLVVHTVLATGSLMEFLLKRTAEDVENYRIYGFTFPEDESNQQCHVMVVKINVSESVNASSIRCDYCTTPDQFIGEVCRQSNNATLLVTSSKY